MQIHIFRGGMGIIRTPILGRLEKSKVATCDFFSKIGEFREGGIIPTRYFFRGLKFREEGNYSDEGLILAFMVL